MTRLLLVALVLSLASPLGAQEWLHVSFGDDPITRELTAPSVRARVEPLEVPPPPPVTAGGAESLRSVERIEAAFEKARQRALPPPNLWPDTHWWLRNPALDLWGYKGIPYP